MIFFKNILKRAQPYFLQGLLLAVLIFILKWAQWKFLIEDSHLEIYIGLLALFFIILGVWVAAQLLEPKVETIILEKEVYIYQKESFEIDITELNKYNLSNREYEVLELLIKGNTNSEIADKLFLSLSTVKTHVSNLFTKLEVKNRTQAIEKANRLKLIG